MGYTLLFAPILLSKTRVKRYRFLITLALLFLFALLLLMSANTIKPFMLASAIKMTCYGFAPALLCAVICIPRFDAYIKAGICTLLGAAAFYLAGHTVNYLFGLSERYYEIDFSNWQTHTNANVHFIILLAFLLVGALLLGVGIYRKRKKV